MGLLLTYKNSTFSIYRIATCLESCHGRLPVLIDLSCALSNKLARYCKICRGNYLSTVVWVWQLYEWRQGENVVLCSKYMVSYYTLLTLHPYYSDASSLALSSPMSYKSSFLLSHILTLKYKEKPVQRIT